MKGAMHSTKATRQSKRDIVLLLHISKGDLVSEVERSSDYEERAKMRHGGVKQRLKVDLLIGLQSELNYHDIEGASIICS